MKSKASHLFWREVASSLKNMFQLALCFDSMTLTQPEVQMFRKLHSNLISLIFGKFLGGPFFLGTKFPGDQISWGPNFLGTTFLGDQISWGPNFPGTKFLGDQMSWGPNFLGTKKVQGPNFWGPNFSGTKFLGAQKTQGPK